MVPLLVRYETPQPNAERQPYILMLPPQQTPAIVTLLTADKCVYHTVLGDPLRRSGPPDAAASGTH